MALSWIFVKTTSKATSKSATQKNYQTPLCDIESSTKVAFMRHRNRYQYKHKCDKEKLPTKQKCDNKNL